MEKAYLINENTDLNKDFSEYDRIYIGDQYCEHNMFYFLQNKTFLDKIYSLKKPITLTTPIISNKNFEKLFIFVEKHKNTAGFEIVVNDYGVLNRLQKKYPLIKIIWGNFLSGQNKDPALKYFKDKNIHKILTIDNDFYKDFFEKINLNNIELYNTYQDFELNILDKINVNIYYPFVVYSINRYCQTALIDKKIKHMQIVETCSGCYGKVKNDFDMQIKIGAEKIGNYFRGNKQFYKNKKITTQTHQRIIYNYDLIKENENR